MLSMVDRGMPCCRDKGKQGWMAQLSRWWSPQWWDPGWGSHRILSFCLSHDTRVSGREEGLWPEEGTQTEATMQVGSAVRAGAGSNPLLCFLPWFRHPELRDQSHGEGRFGCEDVAGLLQSQLTLTGIMSTQSPACSGGQ